MQFKNYDTLTQLILDKLILDISSLSTAINKKHMHQYAKLVRKAVSV